MKIKDCCSVMMNRPDIEIKGGKVYLKNQSGIWSIDYCPWCGTKVKIVGFIGTLEKRIDDLEKLITELRVHKHEIDEEIHSTDISKTSLPCINSADVDRLIKFDKEMKEIQKKRRG